ncbi:MAG: SIMPL domain-containing protein [bacterium]
MVNRLILVGILSVFFLSAALTLANAETEHGRISVSGTAKETVIPDTSLMTFTVTEVKPKADTAMKDIAFKTSKIIEALKGVVPQDNIKTSNISLSADYTWEDNKRIFNGYRVTVTISVKSSISDAGRIIDLAFGNGVTEMGGITYEYSKADELSLELLKKAMINAHRQAETLLSVEEAKVGRVISVSLQQGTPTIPIFKTTTETLSAPEMPVLPGTEEIGVTVNVVYEIEE